VEMKSLADMDCSVAQCLEVMGDKWTVLVLRDAFLGVTRFDDFCRRLGIPRNTLQSRLLRLVEAGVLARIPYSAHPPRHDYRLTPMGEDLWPVLNAMRQWGDRHAAPSGAPIQVLHASCGSAVPASTICGTCGEPIGLHDVIAIPGPGRDHSALAPARSRKADRHS
jgi:DNA-binding HxlR family transcriptional regulator